VACPRGAMIRYWVARSEALRRGVNVKKAVLVHRQVEFAISRLPRVNASCTGISPHRAAKVYRIFLKSEWKGAAPRRSSLRIPTIVLHDTSAAADTSAEPYPS
jgi:hypothetical protein